MVGLAINWSVLAVGFAAVLTFLVLWVAFAWIVIMPRVLRSGPLARYAVRLSARAPDGWSVEGSVVYPLKRGTASGWGRQATLTLGDSSLSVGPSHPGHSLIMPSFAFRWPDIRRIERRGPKSVRVVLCRAGAYLDFNARDAGADEILRRVAEYEAFFDAGLEDADRRARS